MTQIHHEYHGPSKSGMLQKFSAEVFKNLRIIQTRMRISGLQKLRRRHLLNLGTRAYRLLRQKKLRMVELESIYQSMKDLDRQIDDMERELRAIILEDDYPEHRLLAQGAPADAVSQDAAPENPPVVSGKPEVAPEPLPATNAEPKKPAAGKRSTVKTATKKPVSKKTVVKKPAAKKATAEKAATAKKPVAKKEVAKPAAKKQDAGTGRSKAGRPAPNKKKE